MRPSPAKTGRAPAAAADTPRAAAAAIAGPSNASRSGNQNRREGYNTVLVASLGIPARVSTAALRVRDHASRVDLEESDGHRYQGRGGAGGSRAGNERLV